MEASRKRNKCSRSGKDPGSSSSLEPTASTTAENAARTLPLLADRNIRHAVIVCAPLHLYRARWFFRRLYSARGIQTSFTTPTALPLPSALAWELGAMTVRSRQLRAAEQELERGERPK